MNLQEKIENMKAEADTLLRLREEFPDLREVQGRWQTYLVSKKVNERPEVIHYRHSCGCCRDAVLYACFCVQRGDRYIYADPYQVVIGEKNQFYGDIEGETPERLYENRCERIRTEVGEEALKLFNAGPFGEGKDGREEEENHEDPA